jgi:hypothetical protein
MCSDSSETIDFAYALFIQLDRYLIGDLPAVGAA